MSNNIVVLIAAIVIASAVTTLFLLWFFRTRYSHSFLSHDTSDTANSYLKTVLAYVTDGLIAFDSLGVVKNVQSGGGTHVRLSGKRSPWAER